MTEARERRIERLQEATGENTKAGALDVAANFYLQMGAVDAGVRVGNVEELLSAAAERGSLTAPEIAAIIDTPQLPVEADTSFSVGRD
jgi:hypothetical protein